MLERLKARGWAIAADAEAFVVADERRIAPIRLSGTRLVFILPAGARDVTLRSNTFTPAETQAESADRRRLGLCVGRLSIDGEIMSLDRGAVLGAGWHEAEDLDGAFVRRWTDGAASLPSGARSVVVDLEGLGHYWREAPKARAARVA